MSSPPLDQARRVGSFIGAVPMIETMKSTGSFYPACVGALKLVVVIPELSLRPPTLLK
ncbi:hypothetical protein [Brevundimonas balnearis]|uniref:Uncharacterized protein n=1 Tax=Brevundimonas balnearis TaxID=1572858 RepID=A0ABV6R2X4_9CAUL